MSDKACLNGSVMELCTLRQAQGAEFHNKAYGLQAIQTIIYPPFSTFGGFFILLIHLHVEVPRVSFNKLRSTCPDEPSAKVRERVEKALSSIHDLS